MNEKVEVKKSELYLQVNGRFAAFLLSHPEGAAAFANVSNYANSKHRDVKTSLNWVRLN